MVLTLAMLDSEFAADRERLRVTIKGFGVLSKHHVGVANISKVCSACAFACPVLDLPRDGKRQCVML